MVAVLSAEQITCTVKAYAHAKKKKQMDRLRAAWFRDMASGGHGYDLQGLRCSGLELCAVC